MRSTARRSSGSESGFISVSGVLGIAFLALIAYLLLAALNADTSHYGAINLPAQNQPIELPEGETDVYLAQEGNPDQLGELQNPDDLSLSIVQEQGDPVRIDDRAGETENTDDGTTKPIAAVIAPQEGTYLVTASVAPGERVSAPSLTFGLSPLGAVEQRFNDLVDELNGPKGIVVLAALVLIFFAPRIARALER